MQPPLADAVANHALKAVFTCACVKQDAVEVFTGQVNVTADAAGTVNVAWQVVKWYATAGVCKRHGFRTTGTSSRSTCIVIR